MTLRRRRSVWLLGAALVLAAPAIVGAQAGKALSEADLAKLVELKIDDAVIASRIEKSGLDFKPDAESLDRLRKAGASESVLAAVRKASPSPAPTGAAVTYQDVLKLLQLGIDDKEIMRRLEQAPSVFTLGADQVEELKRAGASERLIALMQGRRPQAAVGSDVTDFVLILDCSGSMKDQTREGPTKMEAAKRVVADLVRRIPRGRRVAFMVYGHDLARRCQAVQVLRPLAELDDAAKADLAQAIAALRPVGHTPIALALRVAEKQLAGSEGLSGVILITDGMETCGGDPSAEAARLATNPKLVMGVTVIGFDVEEKEREAVEGIARAGHGKYFDAHSATKLAEAVEEVAKKIERTAPPAGRPTKDIRMAGREVRPGGFFNDAPVVDAGQYKGGLDMQQADYYQVALHKGQELRAIASLRKSEFRVQNPSPGNDSQTFALTIYDQNLAQVAREAIAVPGRPVQPVTWKATWTAPADTVAYVVISATRPHYPHGQPNDTYPENAKLKPAPYTLTLKVQPAAEGAAGATPVPRREARPGNGFAEAGDLTAPGMATTDIKFREVQFFKLPVKAGEPLTISLGGQKPFYHVQNPGLASNHKATFTVTVYDDDQVQVQQKALDVEGSPPDAASAVLTWTPKQSGNAFIAVTCDNTGHDVYVPKPGHEPLPARVALQVTQGDATEVGR